MYVIVVFVETRIKLIKSICLPHSHTLVDGALLLGTYTPPPSWCSVFSRRAGWRVAVSKRSARLCSGLDLRTSENMIYETI